MARCLAGQRDAIITESNCHASKTGSGGKDGQCGAGQSRALSRSKTGPQKPGEAGQSNTKNPPATAEGFFSTHVEINLVDFVAKLGSGLETDRVGCRNLDGLARAGVATLTLFSVLHAERTETGVREPSVVAHSTSNDIKNDVEELTGVLLGKLDVRIGCSVIDCVDQICLRHAALVMQWVREIDDKIV